jgi:hypothetical protein
MNENRPCCASFDRMHANSSKKSPAQTNFPVHRRVGAARAVQALAGTIAALMLAGCPTTGGGGGGGDSGSGAIGAAASSRNIEARNAQLALEQQQRQQVLEARRIERREAALEAIRQRQIAADRIALQQEQEKAKQAQQQANQGKGPQGNQGRGPQGNQGVGQGGIPPGQAKK